MSRIDDLASHTYKPEDPLDTGAALRFMPEGNLEAYLKELATYGCCAWYGRSYCGEPVVEIKLGDVTLASLVYRWLAPALYPNGIPASTITAVCARHQKLENLLFDLAPELLEQVLGGHAFAYAYYMETQK